MCDRCTEVRKHVWHPHARLMLRQCAQREAMQRARAVLPVPPRPAEDPVWVSVVGFVALGILFALAWIATP